MCSEILIGKRFESAGTTTSDGLELPGAITLIQAPELHGSFGGEVLVQLVLEELLTIAGIVDADESITHLAEVLTAGFGLVDRYRDHNLGDLCVDGSEIDEYSLIISVAFTRSIVARVTYGLVRGFEVVVKNDVGFAGALAILSDEEGGGVEVETLAWGCQRIRIPTQADSYFLETDIDTLTFGEIESHMRWA